MKSPELEPLLQFVAARTGTRLSRQQRERLEAELDRHIPEGGGAAYLARLQSRDGALALARLLAVVSVHKTDLFRDEPQLHALETHVLRPLVASGRPLSLWSAGCSTGEEVATLLMLLAEAGAHPESAVLGTDLSAAALEHARRLEFTAEVMKRVPRELVGRYFRGGALIPSLTARARFSQHNLMDRPYPFARDEGGSGETALFDVIVCRNVLIYFTAEAARETVNSFVERLRPGGVLVLSTAEPLLEPVPELTTLRLPGAFFYQRDGGAPAVMATPVPEPVPTPRPSALTRPSAARPSTPRPAITGEIPVVLGPEEEGRKLFELVLEWAATGEDHPETEAGLRKALYLAPQLAGARYLLGLILERRGSLPDAASEYRRALAMLEAGKALPSAFFLNNERLKQACKLALRRCVPSGKAS
jgi:chemotaxis protein methyltransferase CheR